MKRIKQFFDGDKRVLKKHGNKADKVMALSPAMEKLTDEELQHKTVEFRERLDKGETLDDLLVEAFAVVREGARRVLGIHPYRVQVQGGIVLHNGDIAEMKTGEGKTLTATMPVYLNALEGKGVHVVTVNDYLSARDADEMGELYNFLGLTVGSNVSGVQPSEKRAAYNCDITYSTNNELGFDYLRDNMARSFEERVQRTLHFAIIDEVDSILIDEARTPLIISGKAQSEEGLYMRADNFVKTLVADEHYTVDIESKTVSLTDEGMTKAEEMFRIDNLYSPGNQGLVHHIDKAMQANFTFNINKDYVIDEGLIKIVDSFTGRIMEGRKYSEGLHQAIEAKEGVEIQDDTTTIASITYQNFFRMYNKLSGMTGTAKTEEEEFTEIYNMNVIAVDTNRPIQRDDKEDIIYISLDAKYKAIVEEVKRRHELGQPILVGTSTVETSELIGNLLEKEGIFHEVLNAKNHLREADIIMNAGQPGSVTIATNMAGRGTDIKLGPGVKEMGGLAVIGTERHESRRIDDQLRGRAGRQGDPGVSQFYLSLDDELVARFGGDAIKAFLEKLDMTDLDVPIQHKMITKQILSAQERVEGNNYDSRKNVLQYDDVMREQREAIYNDRLEVLSTDNTSLIMKGLLQQGIFEAIDRHINNVGGIAKDDIDGLVELCNTNFNMNLDVEDLEGKSKEEIRQYLYTMVEERHQGNLDKLSTQTKINHFERGLILQVVDKLWTSHINYMDDLKDGITLRSYAQDDPLVMYQEEGHYVYEAMKKEMGFQVTRLAMNIIVQGLTRVG